MLNQRLSENFTSASVMQAIGSPMQNKYAEGLRPVFANLLLT
jgi:glycine/serine hydroxymethyltransferase